MRPPLAYGARGTRATEDAQDVIAPGTPVFEGGALRLPPGPGLGVEIDRDALGRLREQYLKCGIRRHRDDVAHMRLARPDRSGKRPGS